MTGLMNDVTYTFLVTATNALGTGQSSDPSNPVTPRASAAPGAPSSVMALGRDASATATWSPPESDGGSPITAYTVTSEPEGITAQVDGS